jgi:4-carboxymuconolactone decarboxylase
MLRGERRLRLAPIPKSELAAESLKPLGPRATDERLDNIFATLLHHPALFRRYSLFARHVLYKADLDPYVRELAILAIAAHNDCVYEFAQHTLLAKALGFEDTEIAALWQGERTGWPERSRVVLDVVDDLRHDDVISAGTWDRVINTFSTQETLDLLFAIGSYQMVAWALNSLGVEPDPHLQDPRIRPD